MNGSLLPISDLVLAGLLKRLAGEESFVFLESIRANEDNRFSYLFIEPETQLLCRAGDDPLAFLENCQHYLDQGRYLAGWLSYEFGYLLEPVLKELVSSDATIVAAMGVYRAPFIFDHRSGDFVGLSPWPRSDLPDGDSGSGYLISNLIFSQNRAEYLERIARVKEYIESGDTYQVNYTFKLLFDFHGSDADLYTALRRNQSVSYGAFIKEGDHRVLSFSPELFFRKQGDSCVVRPMKGTSRRAPSPEKDQLIREGLAADRKNRSENVMIVDLLRNDLGRLSRMGGVEVLSLFDVETYETLHQMTSSIRGELKPDVHLPELLRALFPCGSVTGAPKIRTMEIIRELEVGPRGIYTGGIGFISPEGDAVFNVPIRTVVLDRTHGEMGIGSGIVYDSEPEKEWEECCLKGSFLQAPAPEFQLIETILFHPRQGLWLIEKHLERLRKSALYWGFPFKEGRIKEALAEVTAAGQEGCRRLRLLLHKDGGIEISTRSCPEIQTAADSTGTNLPTVLLSSRRTDSTAPLLYHKTTCRALYDSEREKAVNAGFFDVLFRNERDEVTEGSITSLFIRRAGELLTPPLSSGLLPGILRSAMLNGEVETPANLPVREAVLTVEDLQTAEAVYVGNSVRGLVAVAFVC